MYYFYASFMVYLYLVISCYYIHLLFSFLYFYYFFTQGRKHPLRIEVTIYQGAIELELMVLVPLHPRELHLAPGSFCIESRCAYGLALEKEIAWRQYTFLLPYFST